MKNNANSTAQAAEGIRRDPRWARVLARDTDADDQFYFSVRSTGVYCRPSCPSRHPLPANVRFHATRQDAEQAGFRPCRRCKPDQASLAARHAERVADACRFIEQSGEQPTLSALALRAGLSPHYFHRLFKTVAGVTPAAYASQARARRLRQELNGPGSITAAALDAGFNSSGRFYAQSDHLLGMTPGRYRAGGKDARIRFALGQCSLGAILVAASDRGICAISLGDEADALLRELQDRFPRASLVGADRDFEQWVAAVVGFVERPGQGLSLPLDVRGSAFQQRVWQALREIPAGTTETYAQVAARIGAPNAARAVAGACAANTLAIAIPCHRVVRSDGAISGYRWGVQRKRGLLERESGAQ